MQPTDGISSPSSFTVLTPSSKAAAFFKNIWQKIRSIASKIFTAFTSCCNVKEFFSSREITLLRDERSNYYPATPKPPATLTDKSISIEKPSTPASTTCPTETPRLNQNPTYITFDPALENLRLFIKEFSMLGVDVIYKSHIAEHLETVQTLAPSLPPVIKSVAKLIVEIGDKAAKPLFKRFAEQKTQTIDPALHKIFNILLKPDYDVFRENISTYLASTTDFRDNCATDYIAPLLTWLSTPESQRGSLDDLYSKSKCIDLKFADELKEKALVFWHEIHENEKANLYDTLETLLETEFKESKISLKEGLKSHYIQPILSWLLLSDHMSPLTDLFGTLDAQKEELIDKIFERAITLLVEKKIDQYSKILETTMHRRLGEITHQMLQKNAGRIADFFSERVSELISSMPFTETVDDLIHNTIHLQFLGLIDAESDLEEQKHLFDKAQTLSTIEPKDEESLDAQIRAQNHLRSVEKYGGKENFLHYAYLEKFSQHPACSFVVQQIIDQETTLILQGKDPSVVRRASQKALYTTIAENFLRLLTPTRKRLGETGEVEEIDPFVELWDMLYLPEEFTALMKHSEELAQELITQDTTTLLEKIKQPSLEILKSVFKSTTKDLLKKHLIDVVQTTFEKITIPEKIDEICAESLFPTINALMIETFASQELGRNLKEFATHFHTLTTCESFEHETQLRVTQFALIKLVKSKFQQFNPQEFYSSEDEDKSKGMSISGLSPLDWLNLTQGIVANLEDEIRKSEINNKPFNPQATSPAEIKDILKKIFKAKPGANNPAFGDMAMNLLFKLGKLSNEGLISFFVKDSLSSSITESVEPWRESYHKLINTTTEVLKSKFSSHQAIEALFSNQTDIQPAFTSQKLAHQIDVTARLAHDIVMGIAQEKGSLTKYATKKFITGGPEELNRIITTIYKKTLGKQLTNENLVVQVFEKIFQSLADSAETIRLVENIRIHQLVANQSTV